MHVDVTLHIISINLKTGEFYRVDNNGSPYVEYDEYHGSLIEACKTLTKAYTNLDPDWVRYHLLKVTDKDYLNIQYWCLVPKDETLKFGTWVKVEDNEFILEIQKNI